MKKTIPTAKVATDFDEMTADELVTFAGGTVVGITGNADLPSPTIDLADITSQSNALKLTLNKISAGDTSSTLQRLMEQQANTLMMSLTTNAHYVEDTANADTPGDLARDEQIILSSGYKLKKRGKAHPRAFELVDTSEGTLHFRTPKGDVKGMKPTLWRYGLADEKGKKPTTTITHFTKQVDIILTDLPSKSIVGIQNSNCETQGSIKKYAHPVFSHTAPDPYDWSDFIYVVVP
jgi:hypothetical protein